MNRLTIALKNLYHTVRKYWWSLTKYRHYLTFSDKDLNCDIIFVTHTTIKGGAPLLLKNVCASFKKKGYNGAIITLEPGKLIKEMDSIYPTILCPSSFSIIKVAKVAAKYNIKTVIVSSALSGNACKPFARYGLKVISYVYELPNTIIGSSALNKYKCMVNSSKYIVYPSNFVKERDEKLCLSTSIGLTKAQGLYNKKGKHLEKNTAKLKLGYPDKIMVLNVASTSKRKGFDFFVDTAVLMPEINFVWVGVQHNNYYNKVLAEHGNQFPENFIEVGYIDDFDELLLYYDASDIFLLTSREEPFGSVFMEAFDAGTPVVAFDKCGGYIDYVKEGMTGKLVNQKTANALKDAINCILKEPLRYEFMCDECLKVASELSFDNYVDFMEKLIYCE